jgi:hypothetical protein
MKESTRKAREQRRHDEALALLLGKSLEDIQALREKEDSESKAREVQAIHLFLENPGAFMEKSCQECHGLFMTNYRFASLCSTPCRINSLDKMGIIWNPMHTATERWSRAQIPTEYSIPPAALEVLLKMAQDQSNAQQLQEYDAELAVEPFESSPSTSQSNNDPQESPVESLLSELSISEEDYLLE